MPFISRVFKKLSGEISHSAYAEFLQNVEKFKFLNDIYLHVARLKKPSFFIIHHEFRKDRERMTPIAELEQALGWKSTFFVPANDEMVDVAQVKQIWKMGHDVGILYDGMERASKKHSHHIAIIDHAWMIFKHQVSKWSSLYFDVIAPDNKPKGVKNEDLWKDYYRFKDMQVKCDTEVSLREKDSILFIVKGRKVQYLIRKKGGGYEKANPRARIWGIRELGRKLKKGKLNGRIIVKIIW